MTFSTAPKTSEPTDISGIISQISITRRLLQSIRCDSHAVEPEITATMPEGTNGVGAILHLDGKSPARLFSYDSGQSVEIGFVKKASHIQYVEDLLLGRSLQEEALMDKTEQAISSFVSIEDMALLDFLYNVATNTSKSLADTLESMKGKVSELLIFADVDNDIEIETLKLALDVYNLPYAFLPIEALGRTKDKVICFVLPKPSQLGDIISKVSPTIVVSQQEYQRKRISVYDQSAVLLKNLNDYCVVTLN